MSAQDRAERVRSLAQRIDELRGERWWTRGCGPEGVWTQPYTTRTPLNSVDGASD